VDVQDILKLKITKKEQSQKTIAFWVLVWQRAALLNERAALFIRNEPLLYFNFLWDIRLHNV